MDAIRKWYRGSLPASIDALKTARKNLAKSPGNLDAVRRIAHTLRISAEEYGLPALSEKARAVEAAHAEKMSQGLDRLLIELERLASALSTGEIPGILIIEQDAQMRGLLETILAGSDRDVHSAGSASEALIILEDNSVALIILDLALPDMDGRNFLVLLRERASTSGVPVIVLSGMGGPQPKTECFALGADAYFEKPLAPEVLKAAVSARLHKSMAYRRESRQDALTGLPNRASFCEALARASALAGRRREPLSLALLDFDLLRRVNDSLGHVAGDAALRHAARAFSGAVRRSDLLARWGGDEFSLLLPNTNLQGGRFAVEKMFQTLAGAPFRTHEGRPVPLSFSAGIVTVHPESNIESVMAEADRCLYMAKASGRGRMVLEGEVLALSNNRVLLAEDDVVLGQQIQECLLGQGFEVQLCNDTATALNAAFAGPFSLVIVDLNRRAIDGHALLREIRSRLQGNRMPALMIVPPGSDAQVDVGFQSGADDYLVKPFTAMDLMTRVRGVLRR